jgi:16S rRNA (adenine1518-N6/adenine1519-N6)-dimethyltransferase
VLFLGNILGAVVDTATMALSDVKHQMEKLGIRPKKRLGQHFLLDVAIANRQVQYASIKKTDTVLEIGPGLGILTKILVEKAKKVVAIEMDQQAADLIVHRYSEVEVVKGDALKVDLPRFDRVVSNLPFNISSPITFRLLNKSFDMGILMYQSEFAKRLVASEGDSDYSRLSVNAYYKAKSEILETVPKSSFYPEPKVDACIVKLIPREPPFHVADEDHYFAVVKALFSHRRKQIRNSLVLEWKQLAESRRVMSRFVKELNNSHKRVEELSPEEIGELSNWILEEKFNLGSCHHSTPPSAEDKDR